jgi:hypothetical protein
MENEVRSAALPARHLVVLEDPLEEKCLARKRTQIYVAGLQDAVLRRRFDAIGLYLERRRFADTGLPQQRQRSPAFQRRERYRPIETA